MFKKRARRAVNSGEIVGGAAISQKTRRPAMLPMMKVQVCSSPCSALRTAMMCGSVVLVMWWLTVVAHSCMYTTPDAAHGGAQYRTALHTKFPGSALSATTCYRGLGARHRHLWAPLGKTGAAQQNSLKNFFPLESGQEGLTPATDPCQNGTERCVVALAIYGEDPLYLDGALRNVVMGRKYWPGWKVRTRAHVMAARAK